MKNINNKITIIVWIFILLFSIQCKEKATNNLNKITNVTTNFAQLPIAYVDADSLFIHFNYYKKIFHLYQKKINEQNIFLNLSYKKLQNEVMNFQQKIQNNAFLSQEKMKQEQIRIKNMEESLKKKATQMEKSWALEQKQVEKHLFDSLFLGIKEFNTPQKYQIIFIKTGNTIIYADERYNITNKVLVFLNKRFKC